MTNPVSRLWNVLYPAKCVFCGCCLDKAADTWLCGRCRGEIVDAKSGKTRIPGGFSCVYALRYRGRVRRAVLGLKFRNRPQAADTLAALMADAAADFAGADLITWVPVSFLRGLRRGYDQSFLLCRGLAARFGKKPERTLVKRRHNRRQSSLGAEQRLKNVADAYRVRRGADVRGKRVLLIDDVLTTGATLSECARTLMRAGAAEVLCAVLARA